jgi:hypothetical protein
MKRLNMKWTTMGFSVMCFLAISCSEKENDPAPEPKPEPVLIVAGPGGDYYGNEMISTPTANQTYNLIAYQTRIDTTYQGSLPIIYATGSLMEQSDSAFVTIGVEGSGKYEKRFQKYYYADKQKWASVYQLVFDPAVPIDCKISADTKIRSSGETKKTTTTFKVVVDKKMFDMLAVNFGMSKAEVTASEKGRLGEGVPFVEVSPEVIRLGNYQFYEFQNDKLTGVSERIDKTTNWIAKIKRLGFAGDAAAALPFSWTKSGLNFTVQEKPFETAPGKTEKLEVITYSKSE